MAYHRTLNTDLINMEGKCTKKSAKTRSGITLPGRLFENLGGLIINEFYTAALWAR